MRLKSSLSGILSALAVCLGVVPFVDVVAQPAEAPPRLIVRADDMGFAHSGNEAILKSYREGIATSVEVIVPSPWFPEAARMLNTHTNVDVGVHLALTSEWDNVKWRPVSHCPSLCDADGYFWPMVFPNKNYPGRSLSENKWRIEDVEKELRAQIELARKHVPRISHVSAHMGCVMVSPEARALLQRLGKEYGLMVETGTNVVKGVSYQGARGTSAEKIESFIRMVERLEPGRIYLFVDHPGFDTPELRAIHHIGYENVAEDRQGVTDTMTSARVKAVIAAKGVRLIGYRDLPR
jgi:predicted glycoside hydrolase/deacetylase ChbG (UPF0249 family)